jgi:drug/metabolite transporter (DMT)-like permease
LINKPLLLGVAYMALGMALIPVGDAIGRLIVRGAFITGTITLIVTAVSKSPIADVFGAFFIGCLFLVPFGVAEVLRIGLQVPHLLLFSAMTSGVANLMSIFALGLALTAWLAPVVYLQIVSATFIGLVFFRDPVNGLTIAGLVLIMSTGALRLPSRRLRLD